MTRLTMRLAGIDASLDVRRDAEIAVTGPFNGTQPDMVSFALAPRYLAQALDNPQVAAVIVPEELAAQALESGKGVAVHPAARVAFFRLHNRLTRAALSRLGAAEIDPAAQVSPAARIAPGARIAAGAVVEDMAYIGPGSVIGPDAYVGPGALVGVCGHFEQWDGERRLRIEHAGRVVLEAGAQVLAGAVVQRDVYAVDTVVGLDAVVGPGVSMAHGVSLGAGSVLTGGTVVAGFTRIGTDVWVGPGATIANNLTIGDGARVEIGAVVVKPVEAGARVSGNFALPHLVNLRNWAEHGRR